MTTPILGLTEWAAAQASPWVPHNLALRYLEQGAMWFRFIDRDLTTPPGSPVDGDCYLVATGGTGTWSGHDGDIAVYLNTAWAFIEPLEGMGAGVLDENVAVAFLGGSWVTLATSTGALLVANNLSDLASAATARTNLGLGSAALLAETTTAEYRANTADRALSTDQVWAAAAYVALTDAATVAVDMAAGFNFSLTIGGNRTLGAPTNTKDGQTGAIVITQDGTGSRTLAYHANWKFAGGTDPVLSTAAGTVDVLFYQVISSTVILANLVKAIA